MKRTIICLITVLTILACLAVFVGCGVSAKEEDSTSGTTTGTTSGTAIVEEAAVDSAFENVTEATGDFVITTEDGAYAVSDGVYTLSQAGTYSVSGALVGQIVVDAPEAEVEIELCGVTITCVSDSPIKVLNAEKVEISAKKDTENVIKDTRSEKTVDSDTQGEGAVYAKSDLKLKGNGVLVVSAGYNNGIHTTKDLTIKNLSLKVTAVNNAIKGNDSVTVESGTVSAISTKGDGVKTEDTDVSEKGNQRGIVTIEDGALAVYAAGDGIQASYDFVMNGGTLYVYTGSYSSYTASTAATTSYKGIKVGNELNVNAGSVVIRSYDDGLHADYGTSLENGAKGKGNINISGGEITIGVYSPTKTTSSGKKGPGGWSNQQSVSGSDAIHADNTLTISGGTIGIDSSYEGLEANFIYVSGGETTVFATDDGMNASKKINNSPKIVVSGGYLFVTVPTSGDTDGIDSNGTYQQTGGVVIACGPGSVSGGMGGGTWALDTDGGVTLQGGTLILFGGMENTPSVSGMTKTVCSSSTVSTGSHTVTIGSNSYTVTLSYSAGGCLVYSDAGSATLK